MSAGYKTSDFDAMIRGLIPRLDSCKVCVVATGGVPRSALQSLYRVSSFLQLDLLRFCTLPPPQRNTRCALSLDR